MDHMTYRTLVGRRPQAAPQLSRLLQRLLRLQRDPGCFGGGLVGRGAGRTRAVREPMAATPTATAEDRACYMFCNLVWSSEPQRPHTRSQVAERSIFTYVMARLCTSFFDLWKFVGSSFAASSPRTSCIRVIVSL